MSRVSKLADGGTEASRVRPLWRMPRQAGASGRSVALSEPCSLVTVYSRKAVGAEQLMTSEGNRQRPAEDSEVPALDPIGVRRMERSHGEAWNRGDPPRPRRKPGEGRVYKPGVVKGRGVGRESEQAVVLERGDNITLRSPEREQGKGLYLNRRLMRG